MTVQITIIGLGQLGASVGLALGKKGKNIRRVGYDREIGIQNKAKKLGAVDEIPFNLGKAIEGADVVVVCIPLEKVEDIFKAMGPDLREGAVVMDFAPAKAKAHQWFEKYVTNKCHYAGLIPALNPVLMENPERGIDSASAELFQKATLGIALPNGTPAPAMKLAEDFARLLDAEPLFTSLAEADGFLTTTHLMPQVLAAALLNSTAGQAGWADARRFASRVFGRSSGAVEEDGVDSLLPALMANRQAALASIELLIAALYHIYKAIESGDESDLKARLGLASRDYSDWMMQRRQADWGKAGAPRESLKSAGPMERMLGSFWGRKKDDRPLP